MNFLGGKWIYNQNFNGEIGSCVSFKKAFSKAKNVRTATLYSASTDYLRVFLNDVRLNFDYPTTLLPFYKDIIIYKFDITDDVLNDYEICSVVAPQRKRTYPQDVLFYSCIYIEYHNGETEKLFSDESWKTDFSYVSSFDAFCEKQDLTFSPSFNDYASVNYDKSNLSYILTEKHVNKLSLSDEVKLTFQNGVYSLNHSLYAVPKLSVKGNAGDKLRVYYSDTMDFNNKSFDEFTLSGNIDAIMPEFSSRKFKHFKIEGTKPDSVKCYSLTYGVNRNADFHCSNTKLNEAYVDCVNKRLEYLNSTQFWLLDKEEQFTFDIFSFDLKDNIEAVLCELSSLQSESGSIPLVQSKNGRSTYKYGFYKDLTLNPIILLYKHFVMYADIDVIKKYLPMCKKSIRFIDDFSGDEFELNYTIKVIYAISLVSKLCTMLSDTDEAYFKKLFESLKLSVIEKINLNSSKLDTILYLYKYKLLSVARLKECFLQHKIEECPKELLPIFLNLLYECGYFEEPFRLISTEEFPKEVLNEWIYTSLIGIIPDESQEGAGFNKVVIKPQIDLSYNIKKASGGYETPFGKISVYWENTDDLYTCCLTVPFEIDATCRFEGFKVINQKSTKETYVFQLKRN